MAQPSGCSVSSRPTNQPTASIRRLLSIPGTSNEFSVKYFLGNDSPHSIFYNGDFRELCSCVNRRPVFVILFLPFFRRRICNTLNSRFYCIQPGPLKSSKGNYRKVEADQNPHLWGVTQCRINIDIHILQI